MERVLLVIGGFSFPLDGEGRGRVRGGGHTRDLNVGVRNCGIGL